MGQPVEQRRGHLGVGEDARPFGKGEIGRQDDRGSLVEPADQVEQHLPAADRERQIAELVEDDEIDADELVGEFSGLAGARLGLELVDQIDRGEEAHAGAVAHAIGADRYGDMALAGAGSADQHGVALGGEKAALVQLAHQPLVDRRDREVELGEVLHHREARHPHAVGGRAGAMIGELGEQQFARRCAERGAGRAPPPRPPRRRPRAFRPA